MVKINKPPKKTIAGSHGYRTEPPKKVRIIGGVWRSRLLTVLDLPGLRPSTDRIRETLFNWLGQDLSGMRCLDVFSGTGALGFEAASRHAQVAVLIEKDKKAHANLLANFALLQSTPAPGVVEIIHGDGLEFLKRQANQSCDLIFIDPPFQDEALFKQAVLEAGRVCDDRAGGGIYIEFPSARRQDDVEALIPEWHCGKYLEAGLVKACLFRSRRG